MDCFLNGDRPMTPEIPSICVTYQLGVPESSLSSFSNLTAMKTVWQHLIDRTGRDENKMSSEKFEKSTFD